MPVLAFGPWPGERRDAGPCLAARREGPGHQAVVDLGPGARVCAATVPLVPRIGIPSKWSRTHRDRSMTYCQVSPRSLSMLASTHCMPWLDQRRPSVGLVAADVRLP